MSIEDLESDIATRHAELDALTWTSFEDVKAYMKQTMLPLMANIGEELAGIDDEIAEFVEGRSDMLTQDTAGIFAAVIVFCRQLVEGMKRLQPKNTNVKVHKHMAHILAVCAKAQAVLEEITVVEEDEPEAGDPADPNAPDLDVPNVPEAQVASGNP